MEWVGLLPLAFHLASAVLFWKIATIPMGIPQWRLAWGMLTTVAASSSLAQIRVALSDAPFHPVTFLSPAYTAIGLFVFAVLIWRIAKPRALTMPKPVAQIVMNFRGIITTWNQAAVELLGWTEAEAKGQELAALIIPDDLMMEYRGHPIPAREAHRQGLRHFRETGEAPIIDTRFRTTAQRRDGQRLEVEVRVTVHGTTFLGQIVPVLTRLL